MKFDNSYARLPERFYAASSPATFSEPELITLNESLAQELGFDFSQYSKKELAEFFSGQKALAGSHYISLAYAGHQFGSFVPSLGDGRAILLGEVLGQENKRFDIQLKGAGPTPFSRRGDGMSALGPVIREYLVSEAMHALGVPATRALAAVLTGDQVQREEIIPGGVFTRVAASHIRIGTFEYFASRGDHEALKTLIDYTLKRHYPQAVGDNPAMTLFLSVREAQSSLVSHWMSLGFIHGVMNTDNMTLSGETIDFGPCAFMDYFNYNQVYSYIDRQGRYAYGNQGNILLWNLARLADCLIPFIDNDEKIAIEKLNSELQKTKTIFQQKLHQRLLKKFGLSLDQSPETENLVTNWFDFLTKEKLDFTQSFRNLMHKNFFPQTIEFEKFYQNWLALKPEAELIHKTNPLYIPRNHLVERAIQGALKGDYSLFYRLNKLYLNPFTEQAGAEDFTLPPKEEEKIKNTFCGT